MEKYLVIDVGGSALKFALMDGEANIIKRGSRPTRRASMEEFLKSLDKIVGDFKGEFHSIALSMPGVIDPEKGFMVSGGKLNFIKNWPICEDLGKRYGCKISVENDARSAALAEKWKGAVRDFDDAVVIVLGSGVGGGIILDGKIRRGAGLFAGEFSFLPSAISEPAEAYDFIGTKANVPKLMERISHRLGLESPDGREIFRLASKGNEIARDGLRSYIKIIARLIYTLNITINPQIFAIGGGISSQSLLYEILLEEIDKIDEFYKERSIPIKAPVITSCRFYNDSNLIGALYNHLKNLES